MNPKIDRLKKVIYEGEALGGGSEYWRIAGNEDLLAELTDFNSSDWEDLKVSLKDWSDDDLWIFADVLGEKEFSAFDVNALYGYVITISNDELADYLIQNIQVLDDGKGKSIELLTSIKERIKKSS